MEYVYFLTLWHIGFSVNANKAVLHCSKNSQMARDGGNKIHLNLGFQENLENQHYQTQLYIYIKSDFIQVIYRKGPQIIYYPTHLRELATLQ